MYLVWDMKLMQEEALGNSPRKTGEAPLVERVQVVVVGAGPVGLSAALFLARHGVSVLVLEKRDGLSAASKASTFHSPTLEIFDEFGAIETMLAKGRIADRIQYRGADGAVLAEFDHALLKGVARYPFRLHLEQSEITPVLLAQLTATGHGAVRFGAEVVDVGSDAAGAWATTRGADGRLRRQDADFVIGADGAHSAVRDLLGLVLDGEEYPGKVLRLVVTDDLATLLPGLGQINYIFAEDGRSISLLQMPDCWRIIIRLAEDADLDAVARPEWYMPVVRSFIPSAPEQLAVRGYDIYGARKMLASAHGTDRVFLIGDALHLTNTRGGMNMNCGIHDAYALGQGVVEALAQGDPSRAEAAARARRTVALEQLLPRTDRAVRGGLAWLDQVREMAADPEAAREMLMRTAMLDMAPVRSTVTGEAG